MFFCRRGEVPCATGCGDRGKTQGEAEENKRPRRRIAARWKELDERRGLQPTGSTGTHHKASTEAFFTPVASSPTTAALAATHQTKTKKDTKESVWSAHKAHHRIRHEKLYKMMRLVGRWVPSIARTTEIRVRIVVVVAPSAGG